MAAPCLSHPQFFKNFTGQVIKYDQARTTARKLALVLWIRIHGQTGTGQVGDYSLLDRRVDTSQEPEARRELATFLTSPAEIFAFVTPLAG